MPSTWNIFSGVLHQVRFDYLPESPLENGWNKVSDEDCTPKFQKARQFPGGLCMQVDGKIFAMDYHVPLNLNRARRLKFGCEFRREAKFYTKISVRKNPSEVEDWWFQHAPGDKAPVEAPHHEWVFSIAPIDGKTTFEIDLEKEVAQVLPGRTFDGLKSIRLRGDICLSRIRLGGKTLREWRPLTRGEKIGVAIGIAGLAVTLIGIIVSLYVPEARTFMGIDKSPKQVSQDGHQSDALRPENKDASRQESIKPEDQRHEPKSHKPPVEARSAKGDSVQPQVQVNNAPNGIAIGGGTVTNPTVNNNSYGQFPPPGVIPSISICFLKKNEPKGDLFETVFTIKTSTPISAPWWVFQFDKPVDSLVPTMRQPFAHTNGHAQAGMPGITPENDITLTIDNIGGFGSQAPWRQGDTITATVTSRQPVQLINQFGGSASSANGEAIREDFLFQCRE
jgi:hypothetical protein